MQRVFAICNIPITTVIHLLQFTVAFEGFVAIKFEQFNNPTGGAANGHCCDGRAFLCEKHGCDYIFKICLDDKDRY